MATTVPTSARPATAYYELVELGYSINLDRTIGASENYTLYNPDWRTMRYTITRNIPTENTDKIQVWSDAEGFSYDNPVKTDGKTTITIHFTLGGREGLTYHISYDASDLVSGTGPSYVGRFGGITLDAKGFPCHRYIVRIRGPAGSTLFLKNPDNAQVLENDPLTVQYETSVSAPGSFDGLEARFYLQPVYYKLTLTEHFSNPGARASKNIFLDTILFSHSQSQFAALEWSSLPIETMYVDNENNWYGVFEIGDLQPGESRDLNIELVFSEIVYLPEITEDQVGTLAEVPAELSPYLKADEYWAVDDPSIQQGAKEVVGSETNAYRVAERIVEFVSSYISYEVTPQRKGALQTLLTRTGDCDCFSDLTIALSRAAGLPARIDFGWGYHEEKFIGHAWVEFYLPGKGWQPADPTWAKTSGDYLFKLDPIHLLRNVCGLSSSGSASKYEWRDSPPSMDEEENIVVLTNPEAARAFIQAGKQAIDLADGLLASENMETLYQKLQLARAELTQAQGASDADAIRLAQDAIQHANIVIIALGKPPSEEGIFIDWEKLLPFLLVAGAIVAVGLVAYWIWQRH